MASMRVQRRGLSSATMIYSGIEPLIDMGRTALNVSGSITAGTLTSRILGTTDMTVFNSDVETNLDGEEQAA